MLGDAADDDDPSSSHSTPDAWFPVPGGMDPVMQKRTCIIGDVHGCRAELVSLLEKMEADPDQDRIIFIGDLINKGPDSFGAFQVFKSMNAEAVLGNHELRLLQEVENPDIRSGLYHRMKTEFGSQFDELIQEISSWPLFIEEPDFLAVHAGLVPGRRPHFCSAEELVNIRTWDGVGQNLQTKSNPPWYMFYEGSKLVVFGHWAALGGLDTPRVIGLDTGCVYGKRLSGLILPERRRVEVPALKAYCEID